MVIKGSARIKFFLVSEKKNFLEIFFSEKKVDRFWIWFFCLFARNLPETFSNYALLPFFFRFFSRLFVLPEKQKIHYFFCIWINHKTQFCCCCCCLSGKWSELFREIFFLLFTKKKVNKQTVKRKKCDK